MSWMKLITVGSIPGVRPKSTYIGVRFQSDGRGPTAIVVRKVDRVDVGPGLCRRLETERRELKLRCCIELHRIKSLELVW